MEQTQQALSVKALEAPGGTKKAIPEKNTKKTIAVLDGVRAIAALLVVSVHISEIAGVPWDVNQNPLATALAFMGRTGVVLFFVLSGFLLFLPYARALLFQEPWPAARTFYLRRIFRIWPGYYLTLLAMILFFAPGYLQPARWPQLGLFLTFFMDSSAQTWQKIDGPFWTLAIEWQYYLLLPLIALGFAWFVRRFASAPTRRLQAVLLCCLLLIGWGLLTRGAGLVYQRHPDLPVPLPHVLLNILLFFTFGMQGKYLEIFAFGMIVSACYVYAQHPTAGVALMARLRRWSDLIWAGGWIVLVLLALWQASAETDRNGTPGFTALAFLHPLRSFYAWLGEPMAGVGYALCIAALLFGSPFLRWFFELGFLRWIGLLSYGLYMWHLNLILFFYGKIGPLLPDMTLIRDLALWAFVGVVLLPFCYLFYSAIEAPGIRLGTRLIRAISRSAADPAGPVPRPARLFFARSRRR
ncbi:MAG TPA: acyltransferase [Ktedonobacteraceae bacterium]|nr:acyltransferase [Ktedonobacteraceae bacterium]